MNLPTVFKIMHDEVSETENIRCNLAIEKMIVDGCECLLEANQVFIREGLYNKKTSDGCNKFNKFFVFYLKPC